MATLPARPNLSHLRRQARDVLRAAQSGDISAVDRIRVVSDRLTLAAAQLAVAREYGFTSWAGLKAEVEARTMDLAQQVEAFCTASIRDWTGRAARMLAATPEIADYSFATAVILGDASRVRREIKRHPELVTRPDDRTGWTALHAASASQWHRLDPARADGLLAVARLLLEAGADPRRYDDGNSPPPPVVYDAVRSACRPELIDLLLAHGADPDAPGPDGRSPYALATAQGRTEVAAVLRRDGAVDDATDTDRFLSACLRADHADVNRQVTRHPELPGSLSGSQQAGAIMQAAEAGNTVAVSLMLDFGFPVDAHGGEDGGTALHAAAYSGSAGTARLLIDRGADIEVRDTHWDSPPLDWAVVGSGERPVTNPRPDWVATVRLLIEAGASTQDITLSPDDPKPPSPEVAELLRGYGIT